MKRVDYIILGAIILLLGNMVAQPEMLGSFIAFTKAHGYFLSFIKFAVLATFGECVALRIVEGRYWKQGFGLIPKAVMWGFLGLFLKASFTVFAFGAPHVLPSLGLSVGESAGFGHRLVVAFTISVMLNTIFAPVLMVLHKILDDHIVFHQGRWSSLISPVDVRARFEGINWDVMWGLVLKKTIPFFWIPVQTVTFMLPPEVRILFAAFLGGVLGVILALASLSGKATPQQA